MSDRQTGRTTRMLAHALNLKIKGKNSLVFAANNEHAKVLWKRIEDRGTERGIEANVEGHGSIIVASLPHALSMNRMFPNGEWADYDHGTGKFRHADPDAVYLIDHHAMEIHLAVVIDYLKVFDAQKIEDVSKWLRQTHAVMSATGMTCNIVSDQADIHEDTRRVAIYPEARPSLNIRTMQDKQTAATLLFDPRMLRNVFAGSLNIINQWNEFK